DLHPQSQGSNEMNRLQRTLFLAFGVATLFAGARFALADTENPLWFEGLKLTNAEIVSELHQVPKKQKLDTDPNMIFIGYTPGHMNPINNYWSIFSGTRAAGFHAPPLPNKGTWNWDQP